MTTDNQLIETPGAQPGDGNNEIVTTVKQAQLAPATERNLLDNFLPLFEKAKQWKAKAAEIVVNDASQLREMELARVSRLALRDVRLEADKIRKALKEDGLRYGRAVQGVYNVIEYLIVPIEKDLEGKEKFAEIQAAKRREELAEQRRTQLQAINCDPSFYDLGNMPEEQYAKVLSAATLAYNKAKEEAEEAARQELLAKAKAEEERREEALIKARTAELMALGVRLNEEGNYVLDNKENPDFGNVITPYEVKTASPEVWQGYLDELKTTATINSEFDKKQAEQLAKAQAEAKKQAAAVAKAKAKAEAERQARLKLEAEAKAKAEADARAIAEAKRREALAPDKDKLVALADRFANFELPTVTSPEAQMVIDNTKVILDKLTEYIKQTTIKL